VLGLNLEHSEWGGDVEGNMDFSKGIAVSEWGKKELMRALVLQKSVKCGVFLCLRGGDTVGVASRQEQITTTWVFERLPRQIILGYYNEKKGKGDLFYVMAKKKWGGKKQGCYTRVCED